MPALTQLKFRGSCLAGALGGCGGATIVANIAAASAMAGALCVGYMVDAALPFYGSAMAGAVNAGYLDNTTAPTYDTLEFYGGSMSGSLCEMVLFTDFSTNPQGVFFSTYYFEEHDEHTSGGPSCELTGGSVEHDEHSGS